MTGGPGKEHRTNKPPPTERVQERSKGHTTCLTTSQNPSLWHPSWLSNVCTTRKDSESDDWLKRTRNSSHHHKTETESHAAEQFSWFPYLLLSTRAPFPNIVSSFVSTCVSLDNSFPSVRQDPTFGPWKGSPFLQQVRKIPWRRKWQPTTGFLPGKSHGQRILVGYSPRGRKESAQLSDLQQQHLQRRHLLWLAYVLSIKSIHGGCFM